MQKTINLLPWYLNPIWWLGLALWLFSEELPLIGGAALLVIGVWIGVML